MLACHRSGKIAELEIFSLEKLVWEELACSRIEVVATRSIEVAVERTLEELGIVVDNRKEPAGVLRKRLALVVCIDPFVPGFAAACRQATL